MYNRYYNGAWHNCKNYEYWGGRTEPKSLSEKRLIIMHVVFILLSAIFAILLHALLPASADIAQLDGILIKWFGFPAVSTFYFILLFTQCALAVRYMGVRADVSGTQIGIRLGIAFAMIYILGMQELTLTCFTLRNDEQNKPIHTN